MSWLLCLLLALLCLASSALAGRDFGKLSANIARHLRSDGGAKQQRELTDDQKHELMVAKLRPAVRLDDDIASFLEEENRFEASMWLHHLKQGSNMQCAGEVFNVCRKHRDWCRQECDLHDPISEQRCHRLKCDTLLESCHHHHFDACEHGNERGVSESWRDVMDSRTHCVKKIEVKCADQKEACLSSCSQHSDSTRRCEPSQCDNIHSTCREHHINSCGDPRLGQPRPAPAHVSSSSSSSSSISQSESSGYLDLSSVKTDSMPHPKPFQKAKGEPLDDSGKTFEVLRRPETPPTGCSLTAGCSSVSSAFSSSSGVSSNGYIRCEEQLAKKCEAAEKACLRKCHAQSLDDDFPKCDPEECWTISQKCSNADLHCDLTDKRVKADEMKPTDKLCTPEDAGCNLQSPDIVERVDCDASNNFCSHEATSPPSTCKTCEEKRYKCLEECQREKTKIITFSSDPIPQPKPCSPRKCFEDADICTVNKCHPEVADTKKVKAEEIPVGSTRTQLLAESQAREKAEEHAALAHLKESAAFCGNGRVDPGEDCDGGFGCKMKQCQCGGDAKPFNPPQPGCQEGPAPCSFKESGCMFGSNQVVPKIVPRGSLFNMHSLNM